MAASMEELVLTFQRERVRFAGVDAPLDEPSACIVECTRNITDNVMANLVGPVVVKVDSVPNELVTGLSYRFYGHWTNHERFGRQFAAKTFCKIQPLHRAGVIRYLMQAPHVGQKIATTLWDKFGDGAVQMLREQPEVAAAAAGRALSEPKALEAAAYLRRESAIEATTIELMELLTGRGFPKNTARRAVAEWGNLAPTVIRRSPYSLMRFRGCGFLRCDQMFLDLGGNPARLKRQALAAWYAIARDTNGNTWHSPQMVERGISERVAGADVRAVDAIRLAIRAKALGRHRDAAGALWLAENTKAKNERDVAERVRLWATETPEWPDVAALEVSDHQRERLAEALNGPLSVFGGGPGCGKTYVSARLIGEIIKIHGAGQVAVAAPTGKAAVRITELMNGYGVAIRARTIHSLLRVASRSEGEGWGFEHDENNPLPFKFIVIDESSMIDTDLCAALFRACGVGTHLLLVGDTGQLPPVGHGAPLRDFIRAGVPTGILTEIRRNAGDIVKACHKIRGGSTFEVSPTLDPDNGANLRLMTTRSSKESLDRIVGALKTMAARGLFDPIWDCQVIVAVNAKSELSRKAVNERLQRELNPGGSRAAGNPFRVGDKVVCLKNSFFKAVEDAPAAFNQEKTPDGTVFVANGEQAAVKHVESKMTIVQLDAPARLIRIPRGAGEPGGDPGSGGQDGGAAMEDSSAAGCQWDLAYGISCHKSQGSEMKIVFVIIDEYAGARMVCDRSWIYTAMSRAKIICFIVGKISTSYAMVQRDNIGKRKTFLMELIKNVGA